ncbi:MAG: Hsp20/alpha crystallin family protein [Deltaproteobacteria bacterium]|nr:Hsp20/alpha crystallin family protein [Deltaproteobacteria bacterium]MBW2661398.1 Hsp20/alpha crystallin family protein [Deltaproteobacteria bacterium]
MAVKDLIKRSQRKNIPVRQEEKHPLISLQKQMNQLFNSFFGDFELEPFRGMDEWYGKFSPEVDVKENDKEITVTAELPGMDEKDIDVSLSGDSLIIKGEKKEEKKEKDKESWSIERRYGSFYRAIPLPVEIIDKENAAASFKKGVLCVTIPKTEASANLSKKIPVKTE